ncbi:hypothetical protein MPNT_70101 [Candidatus Methylacidithermus pantelleriae]|uniref:Uncharacterized protein n=1 Tax=Candidatus Methylacidithermus pantelleriae TaxID=2744239 RepID=A0A8J2FTH0_9BACT|nr:hypothetical protein MPNT_70101 [Candidatus Methylacidithermus pantelleriae]
MSKKTVLRCAKYIRVTLYLLFEILIVPNDHDPVAPGAESTADLVVASLLVWFLMYRSVTEYTDVWLVEEVHNAPWV